MVPPVDVDGATIFASRSGRGIFEFAYTEAQLLYQANDLALASQHLVRDPVSLCYDQARRLLHVAMADGSLATLTLYRAEQVTAWTRQETAGAFRALAEIEGRVWAVVERDGTHRLERFDDELALDAALTGESAAPKEVWRGLDHLEARDVSVVADGAPARRRHRRRRRGRARSAGADGAGRPRLPPPRGAAAARPRRRRSACARRRSGWCPSPSACWRRRRWRWTSAAARRRSPSAASAPRCSTRRRRASPATCGCARSAGAATPCAPLWRIEDDTPLPMTLLSVTTETRITD